MTRNQEIATIIQRQLGRRMFAMIGAKQFVAIDNGLQFKMPSNFAKDGINCVQVVLTPADLYDVKYLKIRGLTVKEIAVSQGIYADMLHADFREKTLLDTHL